jgi:hypothetical protein
MTVTNIKYIPEYQDQIICVLYTTKRSLTLYYCSEHVCLNNFDYEIERVLDQFLKHRMAVLLGASIHEDILREEAKANYLGLRGRKK